MKIKLIASLASLLLFFGATSANASGLSSAGTISLLNAGNGVVLIVGSFSGNPDACPDSNAYILSEDGNDQFKNTYAALLTAYAAEKTLRVFLDGCLANGAKTYPVVSSLVLQ